jgi:hypothetical protein
MTNPTLETIVAKLQVRRGALDDLPILDPGELGYATDVRRLFIGNDPVSFVGDGTMTTFTIRDSSIIPSQLSISVNGLLVDPGIEYVPVGTNIIFAVAPDNNAIITVGFNTEIKTQNSERTFHYERLDLNASVTDEDTNLNFLIQGPLANNTASIEYSLKDGSGSLSVGNMTIITDGTIAIVNDSGSGTTDSGISFNTRIADGRLYLTYTNTSIYPAHFYYSIRLWNTI